jgi:peptidoglycan/LPS O-acetylase OafA/YrhL
MGVMYVVSFALTVALAAFSFHFFEKPFINLKKKISPLPGLA